MGTKDTRIDAYIAKSQPFARPILTHLRRLVHEACPQVEETMKWQFPHFTYKGILCAVAAFKSHCALVFWHRKIRELLPQEKRGRAMGSYGRITSLADLPTDAAFKKFVKESMKLNEAGIKSPRVLKPKKPLVIPAHVSAALKNNFNARAVFEGFPPSHKREYVQWVTEAKRLETRDKRLAKMIAQLEEKKSLNWKYEQCAAK